MFRSLFRKFFIGRKDIATENKSEKIIMLKIESHDSGEVFTKKKSFDSFAKYSVVVARSLDNHFGAVSAKSARTSAS